MRKPPSRHMATWVLPFFTIICLGCLPSDATLQEDVRARLESNPATAGVSSTVTHRVVYLSGKTDTREQQQQAIETAKSVESVKLVINNVSLRNPTLANSVKQALASDPLLANVPIDIEGIDDTVRLMSTQTNAEQRERAVQIANGVAGVGRVEDLMK